MTTYNKETLEADKGNDVIRQSIESGEPFLATKMGSVEKDVCINYLSDNDWLPFIKFAASNNAGISPNTDEQLAYFAEKYLQSLKVVDLLGIWFQQNENILANNYATSSCYSQLRCLEPFYHNNPWSSALEGKTVVVIHPFEDTIKAQFQKRELLFQDKNVLPSFELKTIKAVQTHAGGNGDSITWSDGLEKMKKQIDNIGDFDVSIIGCGAYGLPLGDYIKSIGKQAIHIGGGAQIIFGIKGQRWDSHDVISKLYNKHWVRPSDSEKPKNFKGVEGGCYW